MMSRAFLANDCDLGVVNSSLANDIPGDSEGKIESLASITKPALRRPQTNSPNLGIVICLA